MTSFLRLNQGTTNSYKKIENFSGYIPENSGMIADTLFSENISSWDSQECPYPYEDLSSDGELEEEFSDVSFDDTDREYQKIMDACVEERKLEEKFVAVEAPRLQHPDDMTTILPARPMPSIEEMNECYADFLNAEFNHAKRSRSAQVIQDWWRIVWKREIQKRRNQERDNEHQKKVEELRAWKLSRPRSRKAIRRLQPQRPFDEEYNEMKIAKKNFADARSIIEEHFRMRIVKVNAIKAARKAQRDQGKAFKARAAKKIGPNQQSTWHKERRKDALPIKTQQLVKTEEGKGKRAQRKLKLANRTFSPTVLSPIVQPTVLSPIEEIEMSDEQKEQKEQEEQEDAEMRMFALACVAKAEREEAELVEQESSSDDDEEEYFVKKMAVAMGLDPNKKLSKTKKTKKTRKERTKTKKILPVEDHLSSRARRAMCDSDETHQERTDAFNKLASQDVNSSELKFTKLCKFVIKGQKCPHKVCRFAHSSEQHQPKPCYFALSCKCVEFVSSGVFKNNVSRGGRGKLCECIHPEETMESLYDRLGFKPKVQKTATPEPVAQKTPAPKPVVNMAKISSPKAWAFVVRKAEAAETISTAKSQLTLPWSDVVKCDQEKQTQAPRPKRASRWDLKPAHILAIDEINKRIAEKEESDILRRVKKAKEKALEINKRLKDTTVFTIDRSHAREAIRAIISSGITDFRIEYTQTSSWNNDIFPEQDDPDTYCDDDRYDSYTEVEYSDCEDTRGPCENCLGNTYCACNDYDRQAEFHLSIK